MGKLCFPLDQELSWGWLTVSWPYGALSTFLESFQTQLMCMQPPLWGETEAQGATPICPELLSSLQSQGLVPAAQQHPLNVMPTTFYGLTDTYVPCCHQGHAEPTPGFPIWVMVSGGNLSVDSKD